MFWREMVSMGDPVDVIQNVLRFLDEDLSQKAAKQKATAIIADIPKLVSKPKEWIWRGSVTLGRDDCVTGIMLEAIKPRRRWRYRIALSENSN
jgi:hypothetical protein